MKVIGKLYRIDYQPARGDCSGRIVHFEGANPAPVMLYTNTKLVEMVKLAEYGGTLWLELDPNPDHQTGLQIAIRALTVTNGDGLLVVTNGEPATRQALYDLFFSDTGVLSPETPAGRLSHHELDVAAMSEWLDWLEAHGIRTMM